MCITRVSVTHMLYKVLPAQGEYMSYDKQQPSMLSATLVGGIVGSVSTALFLTLSDEERRRRFFKRVDALMEKTGVTDAVEQGKEKLQQGKEKAQDLAEEGKDRARDLAQQAKDKVRGIQPGGQSSDDTESRSGDDQNGRGRAGGRRGGQNG